MATYSDLNITHEENNITLLNKLQKAIKLGYEVIAVNHIVPRLDVPKEQKKKNKIVIPEPNKCKPCDAELRQIQEGRQPLKILSRLSACLTEGCYLHKLSDPVVQNYDILAVQPDTEKLFHQACTSLDVDIISIDVTTKLPFIIKRNPVNTAIRRGIHFELVYTPALRDSTVRRYTISNGLMLVDKCKGKNIILSSGCEKPIDLRGPLDVANIGLLFGLTQAQCKDAVSKNCKAVLSHADARKLKGSAIRIGKISDALPEDKWILEKGKSDLGLDRITSQNKGKVMQTQKPVSKSPVKETIPIKKTDEKRKNISLTNGEDAPPQKKLKSEGT